MRWPIVWTIYRKELTETLRDWRTLLMMVGLPILLYPIMILGAGSVQQSTARAIGARVSTVGVWGEAPAGLLDRLAAPGTLAASAWKGAPAALRRALETGSLEPPTDPPTDPPGKAAPGAPGPGFPDLRPPPSGARAPDHPVVAAAREAIAARVVDAVLVPWPGFSDALARDGRGRLFLYYDWVRPESKQAFERVRTEVGAYRDGVVKLRLEARGLSEDWLQAVDLRAQDVAPAQKVSGHVLGTAVSFLLIMMSLLGGLYPSIDLTAGEKERGTMETLLCVPLRSTEIIVGKFLTVWTISIVTGLANLGSIAATFGRIVPGHGLEHIHLTPSAFVVIFLLYLPVSFITSAVFLAVGAFAKDFKDGQNLVTPVYMIFALPSGLSLMPGVELSPATAFVPVLNIALLIKAQLLGEAQVDLAFLTLISSAAYGTLAVLFAARVFGREQVLLGGRESLRATLGIERRGEEPSPGFAGVAAAVLLVVMFYGSLALDPLPLLSRIAAMQGALILAPTLLLAVGFGFPWRRTFSLRLPTWPGLALAIVVGASAWTFAAGVLVRLVPPPSSFMKEMEDLFYGPDAAPLWLLWAVIAVAPAVCEELLFRGLVLSGLRRLGAERAILLGGLLFAAFHASLYRLLPTLFLGVVIGIVVWRTRSILCGMIVHALNNGIVVALSREPEFARRLGTTGAEGLPLDSALCGTLVLVVGLGLLQARSVPAPDPADAPGAGAFGRHAPDPRPPLPDADPIAPVPPGAPAPGAEDPAAQRGTDVGA